MDATKLRDYLDLELAIIDIRRKHGLLAEVLERTDLKTLKGAWIRHLKVGLEDAWNALDDGESEILNQRRARENAKEDAREKKPKGRRPAPVRGAVNENLSHDPSTIPGAIRMVLARCPAGLRAQELLIEVIKVRPGTERPSLSSALHPMVQRREIVREGFHKNYKYLLVSRSGSSDPEEAREN